MYKTILQRTSVRTYTNERLSKEKLDKLLQYIKEVLQYPNPFSDAPIRIEYVPHSLTTFGVISGANEYLVLVGPKFEAEKRSCQLAVAKAGYLMEYVILYATSLGLGTCWIGK